MSYDRGGARRLGAWVGRAVVDLPDVVGHPAFPTTMELLVARSGGTTLDAARDALEDHMFARGCRVPKARLLVPVMPISLLQHRWILGPDDPVPWPSGAEGLDYHFEIACVIGRQGRDLTPAQAAAYPFGFTIMNDWSWHAGSTNGRAAVKRFATSLGPCIVTADEFHPTRGRLLARVNGEIWSQGRLDRALATFPELIAELSRNQTLYPGDIVGSGTFQGGCALDLGLRVPEGAVVELEAEGIGTLRNTVGAPLAGRAA